MSVKDSKLQGEHDLEKTASSDGELASYPPTKVVIPIIICISLAFFLAALDRTIVGVAVPAISDEFQSFSQVSWYQAAFTLTNCVFQLPAGRIYTFFPPKWITITSVAIFEIGSIVCAAAPSSVAFIIGRAITGIGVAGITVGAQVVIRDIIPASKRPAYQGIFGMTFGVASIIGPIVGGEFTSHVSWRWCFWISVPIAGLALAGLILLLPNTAATENLEGPLTVTLKKFDPLGNAFLLPGLVCLLLGLQWGGVTYPWASARVVVLLALGSICLVGFALVQFWVKDNGTVPPRILARRSILAATASYFGIGSLLVLLGFYLPIWFEVVQGVSAGSAGLRLLPYFLSTVVFVIASGVLVARIGYYTPFLIIGSAVLMVGTGLLTTFRVSTGKGSWIGYQILLGAGLGLSLQQPINAAQTILSKNDIPTGVTILTFAQTFGGTIMISVAESILSHTLTNQLSVTLPGFDVSTITSAGLTDVRDVVSAQQLPEILNAYNKGLDNVFYCALGAAAVSLVASLFMEWNTVKKDAKVSEK